MLYITDFHLPFLKRANGRVAKTDKKQIVKLLKLTEVRNVKKKLKKRLELVYTDEKQKGGPKVNLYTGFGELDYLRCVSEMVISFLKQVSTYIRTVLSLKPIQPNFPLRIKSFIIKLITINIYTKMHS